MTVKHISIVFFTMLTLLFHIDYLFKLVLFMCEGQYLNIQIAHVGWIFHLPILKMLAPFCKVDNFIHVKYSCY